ncbi:glycosyltransferase family 2 protein [Candidatus Woesebacteria bacterium]|nr:glycosyltransferase family 2 protein [Candidatus Woesebacteria bacterium]
MKKSNIVDLSIIIVSYNTKKLTESCIKSIKRSKPRITYEIVVVDNGSADSSVKLLKKLKKTNLIQKLIVNKRNAGFAKANNQGLKVSKGKYKLLLNSDTVVEKGVLEKMISFSEKHNDAGVIGSKLILSDGSVQESCFNFPTVLNAFKEYWLGQKKTYDKFAPKGNKPVAVDAIVGAAFLITPKGFKKVGMLNEKYFMYFEDIDYCWEIEREGLKTYYLPNVKIKHLHGASGKKMRRDEVYQMLHNSSKNYHGKIKHFVIQFILWSGQKMRKSCLSS